MLLARAGADVEVLERKRVVGGRSAIIEQDGFRFDRGPTFFLFGEVLEKSLTLAAAGSRTKWTCCVSIRCTG